MHAHRRSARTITAARRLAAILTVDVVGYSRLMGEDEPGTARWCGNIAREAARPITFNATDCFPPLKDVRGNERPVLSDRQKKGGQDLHPNPESDFC